MIWAIGQSIKYLAGCALALACILASGHAEAKTRFRVLYAFEGGSDGASPEAGLVRDGSGNLYGTTYYGGSDNQGTVFRLSPDGTENVLYSFDGNYGAYPQASITLDKKGNLYGTTVYGGGGSGNVFKLTPDGSESELYAFSGGKDGAYPASGLLIDKTGNLYGTNPGYHCDASCGAVYKVAPNGALTVLHTFPFSGKGGAIAYAVPISGHDGNIYGTASSGGDDNCYCGTVYSIGPHGKETVLHVFVGGPGDGGVPLAGVVADGSGNLYGTTSSGGINDAGTVFKLAPDGTTTLLYSFAGSDGNYPAAALVSDAAGNLYGTTMDGGPENLGVVFELATDGSETVLHAFRGGTDGATPVANLIADSKGNLYGTAESGGTDGAGVVFEIEK